MKVVKEKDGAIGIHPDYGDEAYVSVSQGIHGDRKYGNIYISFPATVARDVAQEIFKKLEEQCLG